MSRRSAATVDSRDSPWTGGAWAWLRTPDRRFLVLAILLQLALAAIPLHRSYDRTVFEAAGYLVATGHSPYVPQDLSAVFHAAFFRDFATIGYPPPWPLLLGGIYRVTYAVVPNLQLYAVAIKLPVIAAGIGLAYLSGASLHNLGAAPLLVRRAWLAILFNPFLIYVAAVRGQIDPIVAVLALAAVLLVASGRRDLSAVTVALAVCVKPTAAPLLLAVLLAIAAVSLPRALRYAAVVTAGVFAFYVVPFFILGWDGSPLHQANSQFALAGAMSPATIARVWTDPVVLDGHWWLLGLLWIPSLVIATVLVRRGAC
ncbi:MAG: glycosyltransferase 87 family protein, partial [Deltaproteobacteria bacterium]